MSSNYQSIFKKGGKLSIVLDLISLLIAFGLVWVSKSLNVNAAPSDLALVHAQ